MKRINFSNKQRKGLRATLPIFLVLLAITLFFLLLKFLGTGSSVNFIFHSGPALRSTDGQVNILLLGIGGENHDGPYLTDTVMVAVLDYKKHKATLISLPRDLWVDSIKEKVNTAYGLGLNRGQGLKLAKNVVGDILGLSIHYGFRVDFGGFIKAVDDIGGIDITVDRSFDDYLYPLEGKEDDLCGWEEKEMDFNEEEAKKLNIGVGKMRVFVKDDQIATDVAEPDKGNKYFTCRFEHISFKAGPQHMDGATALKFVRSRHGLGGEGSDFARSKRQEKVLETVRNKILSLETLANPAKVASLIGTFGKSIDTDIQVAEFLELYKLVRQNEGVNSFVIDAMGKAPLLINPPVGQYGGWVLIPRAGANEYNDIHEYVKTALSREVGYSEATVSARPSR